MGFLMLSTFRHPSGVVFEPGESIRVLGEHFPEALVWPGDQLAAEAYRAEDFLAAELRANPESPARSVVEGLRRKARNYGPAYAFEFPLEYATKLRGHARRYDITFLFEQPIGEDMRQRILAFLKSFNVGKITTATAEQRQPVVLCDMPGPAAPSAAIPQDLPIIHSDNPSPGAA